MTTRYRYAYLHGFASGPASYKGSWLSGRLAEHGVRLELPDLNRPSFAELTLSGALEAIDGLDASGPPWRFVGSSMGGYLAARWAELHPDRVDRLVLLCPGFRLSERWPSILGADAMARWRSTGRLALPDANGHPVEVGYALVEDAATHPGEPEVPCETVILHGARDEQVPVDGSRAYARRRPHVRLVEVDDDHGLTASLDALWDIVVGHFEVTT